MENSIYQEELAILEGMIKSYELRLDDKWYDDRRAELEKGIAERRMELEKNQDMRLSAKEQVALYELRCKQLTERYHKEKNERSEIAKQTRKGSKSKELTKLQLEVQTQLRAMNVFSEEQILQTIKGVK